MACHLQLKAEIRIDSRARRVFAGVSLEGSTLRPDNDTKKECPFYRNRSLNGDCRNRAFCPLSRSSLRPYVRDKAALVGVSIFIFRERTVAYDESILINDL
jgi:hypothetical protein